MLTTINFASTQYLVPYVAVQKIIPFNLEFNNYIEFINNLKKKQISDIKHVRIFDKTLNPN